MPDFSERYGYVQKPIQVENMSEELRNRIWNTYRCEIYIDTDDPYNQVYSNYLEEIGNKFKEAMDNDFNTSLALSILFEYHTLANKLIRKNNIQEATDIAYALKQIYKVLGLLGQEPEDVINNIKNKYIKLKKIDEKEIAELILKRKKYKLDKNYIEADKIRDELLLKGILINDKGEETTWDIDFTTNQNK